MRKKIMLALASTFMVFGAFAATAPSASASAGPPVRAGYDDCGNFQIWVNGNPTIYYFVCNGA